MAVDGSVPDYRQDGRSAPDLGDARSELRKRLALAPAGIAAVNALLTGPDNPLVEGLLDLIDRYGGVAEINRKAAQADRLEAQLGAGELPAWGPGFERVRALYPSWTA